MLSAARKRLLVPATTALSHIRAALTGGGGGMRAWYATDFDLGKKPGDWDCATCFHLNFSRRDSCQRCGNPRPLGAGGSADTRPWGGQDVKPGDWFCGSCHTHNFANRSACFKCGAEKTENAGAGAGAGADSPEGRPGWRSGDWLCRGCNEHNFANRSECFKCNAPREDESASSSSA